MNLYDKVGVGFALFFFAISILLACSTYKQEDQTIDFTVKMVQVDDENLGPEWVMVESAEGMRKELWRADLKGYLKGNKESWKKLSVGQKITLEHHARRGQPGIPRG